MAANEAKRRESGVKACKWPTNGRYRHRASTAQCQLAAHLKQKSLALEMSLLERHA